jgi:hypothetical protein
MTICRFTVHKEAAMFRRASNSSKVWPVALVLLAAIPTQVAAGDGTLVLPFRPVAVSEITVSIACGILAGELESQGVVVLESHALVPPLPMGTEACDASECARSFARSHHADRVVYGSVSRLGEKRIVRAHALRVGEDRPYYNEQISAVSEGELETVMRRIAEGIAAGSADSDQATVGSVTREEATSLPLRRSRRGLGVRGGFLVPSGGSYGGADRLASLRVSYKHEGLRHLIETTTLTGVSWGDGALDWTLFSLYGARIFGTGDCTPYVGGGLGLHHVRVERTETFQGNGYSTTSTEHDGVTAIVIELGVGLLALRTYDFEVLLDLRYRYVADEFEDADGKGAHGILLTFGTSH